MNAGESVRLHADCLLREWPRASGLPVGLGKRGMALACAAIIAAVTFVICVGGLVIGRRFGTKLAGRASILGGIILIGIGIEIFVTGVF